MFVGSVSEEKNVRILKIFYSPNCSKILMEEGLISVINDSSKILKPQHVGFVTNFLTQQYHMYSALLGC